MDVVVADINGGNAEVARDVSHQKDIEVAPVSQHSQSSEIIKNEDKNDDEIKMNDQEINGDVKNISNKKIMAPIAKRKLRRSKANSTGAIDSDHESKDKSQKRKLSEPDAINSEDSMDFNGFDISRKQIEPGVEIIQKLIAEAEALEIQNVKRVRRSISKGPRRNIEFKTVDDHSGKLDTSDIKIQTDVTNDSIDTPKCKKESDIESDDTQKHEDSITTRSPSNNSSSMALPRQQRGVSGGKQKGTIDMMNPLFREPFKYGWKREIIYNGETENSLKKNIEVYYYTPKGKKVRNLREIAEFLNTKELTIDNFTFVKESTGVNDSEYEIIKEEFKTVNSSSALNTRKMGSVGKRGGVTRRLTGKMASPLSPPVKSTSKWSSVKSSTPAGIKVKVAGKRGPQKKSISPPKETEILSPMWSNTSTVTRRNQAAADKNVSTYKTTKRSLKPKVQEPCSIRCAMSMGLIPSLQCCVCLCLYHPECVGHKELSTNEEYICKNCRPNDETKKSITPPPLIPISMIGTQNLKSGQLSSMDKISPPKLQKIAKSENMMNSITKLSGKNSRISNNALSTSKIIDNSSSWYERNDRELRHRQDISEPKPAQNIALLAGKRYIVVPKNNAMSVQPAIAPRPDKVLQNKPSFSEDPVDISSVTKTPNVPPFSSQFLNDDNIERNDMSGQEVSSMKDEHIKSGSVNQKISDDMIPTNESCISAIDVERAVEYKNANDIPSNCQSAEESQSSVKTTPAIVTDKMNSTKQSEQLQENVETTVANKEIEKETNVEVAVNGNETTTAEMKKPPPIVEIDQRQYFMTTVCAGYNALSRVFQYLKVQELLRASRVCKMWRDIAAQPSLWKTVRMKNSQVSDWKGLAASLERHGTQHLDLRKMLIPGESDDIWGNFVSVIPGVTSLIKLELCRCPVMVVEKIIEACPQLEILCAMSMKCDWLNLESIDKLERCQELRLKAISGMSINGDLTPLGQLTKLTHLSLTSVKELGKKKIEVLGSLINLETLELGECSDFPSKFGTSVMCKLTKLERLRLEKGQGTCCTFDILNGVAKLEKLHQLELVNFDVKNGFDKRLANCKNIKRLLIIPTYISQSATSNNMVLGGVTELSNNLTHFVWGVTLELLRVTELFVDQCNQTNKQVSGDSIPVLKPVPCLQLIEDNINDNNDSAKGDEKQLNLTNPQVDILPLPQLQKLLLTALPKTRVKILKIPFHATWRQSITDSSSQ